MNYVGKNIRTLRIEKGIKQSQIADKLGFKRTTWASYESGKSTPSVELILELCEYFDINPYQFVYEDLENVPNRISNVETKQFKKSTTESTKLSTKWQPNFQDLMDKANASKPGMVNEPSIEYESYFNALEGITNAEWNKLIKDATTQAIASLEAMRVQKLPPEVKKMRQEVQEYIKENNLLKQKLKQLEKDRSENAQKKNDK